MKLSIIISTILSALSAEGFTAPAAPIKSTIIPDEVNLDAALAKSTFPHTPDDLVSRAKEVLSPDIGIGTKDDGACLAGDFEFVAAVVGPISKEEYLNALNGFKLEESFDIQQNMFGFTVDPMQTNRVWWFDRQVARQISSFMGVQPISNELILPPQLFHMDFNEEMKVKEFGFYTVDRRQGNTGGLGGAFGYFYGVGKPLPIRECQPFKPSFRFRMLGLLGKLGKKFAKKSA